MKKPRTELLTESVTGSLTTPLPRAGEGCAGGGGSPGNARRALFRRACKLVLSALAVAVIVRLAPLPAVLSGGRGAVVIEDARGQLLREPPGDDGLRAEWVSLDEVPEAALAAMVQSEDHHLGWHPGVDPVGIVRALWLDLSQRRLISGASTLAMQLARLSYGLPRTFAGKLQQAALGVFLQARLGADGVLEAYVNLAPYGRDVRGLRAASRVYFGKPLRDLTTGEAVALACLPRGPTVYDPYRHPERLRARRAHVLALMQQRGVLSRTARVAAEREALHLAPFERSFRAPHASALALSEARARGAALPTRIRTSIDSSLQRSAQWACKSAVASLEQKAATDCAAVVMRVSSGEVLALVGSPDFRSPQGGQVNAALALRQPGSALKPFVYALAFETGRGPASTIADVPTSFPAAFGDWVPANYDGRFHGQVTLREALANSYNIPAAKLAQELGVERVVARLLRAGLATLDGEPARYGIGIALGDGEVTLYDLVTAYATLARGGEYLEPTTLTRVEQAGQSMALPARRKRKVFSAGVSYMVGHVLQDRAARRASFGEAGVLELPFDVAVKTGTSSSYRDNWTVGFTRDVVVGVWVGRHDGAPMHGISGVAGAGPAFRRIMLAAAGKTARAWPSPPPSVTYRRFGVLRDLALVPGAESGEFAAR